jgi:two-component system CheB/CheR fusion protein
MVAQGASPVSGSIPICGIGASAGGVEALQQFFQYLPADVGLAYVVIVHLAPDRKSELPSIIGRWTSMPVTQVTDHEMAKLEPNRVYVIAPDRKLEITDSSVGASSFEQPRGRRAAIDLFFRSLAQAHGDGFAIVLSGSGSDGALGAKAVKERGGLVLVQDPREAGHADMPRAVMATGAADVIAPVRELAATLVELARSKQQLAPEIRDVDVAHIPQDEEKSLRQVLDLLRKQTGHDFLKYKRATVLRRLSRRMQLNHQLTIADYLQFARSHSSEVQALLQDLLISVTTFFRDADAWAELQTQVIGPLIENSDDDEQIRAWVVGCATGEEAAILL